jgi:hypothetical protein
MKVEQRINLKFLVKFEKKKQKSKIQSMLWKTSTLSSMNKSKNEQVAVAGEGNDDSFLRHQRRNHD